MRRKTKSMGRIVFVRTMVSFLVFWAVMMGVISNLNYRDRKEDLNVIINNGFMYLWENLPTIVDQATWNRRVDQIDDHDADGWWLQGPIEPGNSFDRMRWDSLKGNTVTKDDLPAIMEWLFTYGLNCGGANLGMGPGRTFRIYDYRGQEIARGPISIMAIRDQFYNRNSYICFDPLLDDEGQLELIDHLYSSTYQYGATTMNYAYFRVDEGKYGPENFGEVTGIVEGNRIYPQRITYTIDGETSLVFQSDDLDLFTGAELSTVQFAYSGLETVISPEREYRALSLELYHQAQAMLDAQFPTEPISYLGPVNRFEKNQRLFVDRCQDDRRIFACAYVWNDVALATYGLGRIYLATFLCALLLAMLVSWRLSRSLSRPLTALTKSVETGADQYDQTTRVAEVNTLAAAFQTAQEALKEDLEREQSLTRAMAHELKTPLGIIRTYAEALEEDISPENRGHYLTVLQQETDRMNALVLRLLELSRLERSGELEKAPADLAQLVEERAARLAPALEERGLILEQALEPVTVLCDGTLLGQAAENFLTNALRHTPEGGRIWLTVERAEDSARLTVENQGNPIPDEDLPRLWDTFFKGDKARTRDAGGAGLGLAIVR